MTLNSTLNAGDAAGLFVTSFNVRDDQTWSGTGTVVFGGNTSNNITSGVTKSLTIGSGLTVRRREVGLRPG